MSSLLREVHDPSPHAPAIHMLPCECEFRPLAPIGYAAEVIGFRTRTLLARQRRLRLRAVRGRLAEEAADARLRALEAVEILGVERTGELLDAVEWARRHPSFLPPKGWLRALVCAVVARAVGTE